MPLSTHSLKNFCSRCCRVEQLEDRLALTAVPLLVTQPIVDAGTLDSSSQQPVFESTASIAGKVLVSSAPEGIAPQPIANSSVWLLDESGIVVDQQQSDSEGAYRFENVAPGLYGIQQIQPEGHASVGAEVGSGGGIVFDENLIGEIAVASSVDSFSGYNFYEIPFEATPQEADPGNRAVVAHGNNVDGSSPQELVSVVQFVELSESRADSEDSEPSDLQQDSLEMAEDVFDESNLVAEPAQLTSPIVSSQEMKERPAQEPSTVPDSFWNSLELLDISSVLTLVAELPWFSPENPHAEAAPPKPAGENQPTEQAAKTNLEETNQLAMRLEQPPTVRPQQNTGEEAVSLGD